MAIGRTNWFCSGGLADLENERKNAKVTAQSPVAASKLLEDAFAEPPPAPAVRHKPVTETPAGKSLTVTAEVTSPVGVKWVRLRYRGVNQHFDYKTLPMAPTGHGDEYQAVVPASEILPKWDFMYYIEVMDQAGHGKIHPDLEKETPYVMVKLKRK